MGEIQRYFSLYGKSPLYQLFISILVVLIVGLFIFTVTVLAGALIFNWDLSSVMASVSSGGGANDLAIFRFMLITQEFSIFLIPGIIIQILMEEGFSLKNRIAAPPAATDLFLVILLAFCLIPVTGLTGMLNSEMHLPEWLSGLEQWMIEKEESASLMVNLLMSSQSAGVLLLNIFMIALLPGIGEELIFRGVLQKLFCKLFNSGNLAVWITAFIFSAIHFQFFGFVPRFILGLVFGYLFLWSGNLWLSIIAHFMNNAISVVAEYFQRGVSADQLQSIITWREIVALIFPVIICVLILIYFRKKGKQKTI